jgi:hypothetical protein
LTSEPPNDQILTSSDEYGLRRRLLRPRTAISFLVGAGIVVLAISRLDLNWDDIYAQLRAANVGYILLAFMAYYGSIFIRSVRWRNLLDSAEVRPDPGYEMPRVRGMAAIYMVSWYFNCLLPAKLGDAYRDHGARIKVLTSRLSELAVDIEGLEREHRRRGERGRDARGDQPPELPLHHP